MRYMLESQIISLRVQSSIMMRGIVMRSHGRGKCVTNPEICMLSDMNILINH